MLSAVYSLSCLFCTIRKVAPFTRRLIGIDRCSDLFADSSHPSLGLSTCRHTEDCEAYIRRWLLVCCFRWNWNFPSREVALYRYGGKDYEEEILHTQRQGGHSEETPFGAGGDFGSLRSARHGSFDVLPPAEGAFRGWSLGIPEGYGQDQRQAREEDLSLVDALTTIGEFMVFTRIVVDDLFC